MTFPPRPPGVFAPKPSAPGKAGRSPARARIVDPRTTNGRRYCTTKAGRYMEFFYFAGRVNSSLYFVDFHSEKLLALFAEHVFLSPVGNFKY
jgi:hypothetical protein